MLAWMQDWLKNGWRFLSGGFASPVARVAGGLGPSGLVTEFLEKRPALGVGPRGGRRSRPGVGPVCARRRILRQPPVVL